MADSNRYYPNENREDWEEDQGGRDERVEMPPSYWEEMLRGLERREKGVHRDQTS